MLSTILIKHLRANPLLKNIIFKFGTASHQIQHHDEHHVQHDDHHHHDYSVHIDKNATWLKYNGDPKFISIYGMQNTHVDFKDPDTSDPYVHIKQNPLLSFQNLAYNDPYYHEDEHEALVNEQHGYNYGQDPIDNRWDVVYPWVLTASALMTIVSLYFYFEGVTLQQAEFRVQDLATRYAEAQLTKKNNQLNDLRDKIRELSNKNQTV